MTKDAGTGRFFRLIRPLIPLPAALVRQSTARLYYPEAIIKYANTRGADKVMYAGYYPMGLSLRRIHDEMQHVPLKDDVWPKFLRDNARRVFKLGE